MPREYAAGSRLYVNGNDPIRRPRAASIPAPRIRGYDPVCGNHSFGESTRRFCAGLAGEAMFHFIGPPPGAYAGPYPTKEEAIAALTSGTTFQVPESWNYEIPLTSGTLAVPFDWFDGYFRCRRQATPGHRRPPVTFTTAVWRGRCLIVRTPFDDVYDDANLYLIDLQKKQLFAMYTQP